MPNGGEPEEIVLGGAKHVRSPILGLSRVLSHKEQLKLEKLVREAPLAVFQTMNRELNKRGLLFRIIPQ